jgi:ABC-type cobalt transport system substrate-binding protein
MANTQGAPTTGLGQNVTFVGDPVTGAPVMSRLDEAELNVLGSQAPRQQAGAFRQANFQEVDAVTAAFTSLGTAIAGKVREKEQESFVRGAMDAAQGKTVEQIADEQPWYANLFGPSSAELGAKAYTNQEKVNVALARIQAQMATLSQLPYEKAREELTNSMNSLLTGNPEEDAFVRQSFLKNMPSLVEDYTKQRVTYVNQLALVSQSRARRSSFELIENDRLSVVAGRMTQEQADALANSRLADTLPVEGQNLVMWEKTFTDDLVSAAQAGYLQSVRAGLANGREGLLTPANRDRVKAAEKQGNSALRAKWIDANAEELAKLESAVQNAPDNTTVAQHYQALIAFGEAGNKETGATEDVYDKSRVIALLKGGMTAVQARIDQNARRRQADLNRAATADAKAKAAADIADEVNAAWARGDLFAVKQHLKDEEIETRGFAEYASFGQKHDEMAKFLKRFNLRNEGVKFDSVATQLKTQTSAAIESMVKSGVTDAGIAQMYEPWKALNAQGISPLYFGESLDGKMTRFHNMMQAAGGNQVAASIAFTDAFVRNANVRLTDDEIKKLKGGMFSGGTPAFNELPEESRAYALSFLDIKSYPTALEGVQRTLPHALSTGKLEVFGKGVVYNGNSMPVKTFLRDPKASKASAEKWELGTFETDDSAVQGAFNLALQWRTRGYQGATNEKSFGGQIPDTVEITASRVIRTEQGGQPLLVVMQSGDDGKVYNTAITMDDLYAARAARYWLKNGGMYGKAAKESRDLWLRAQSQLTKH